jgi:hypothetical protein
MFMLSDFDNVKFLHPVGTSTLKYGVTIPLEAQTERMRAIEKGGKVPVTIVFGIEEPVKAEIRRLNNRPGPFTPVFLGSFWQHGKGQPA